MQTKKNTDKKKALDLLRKYIEKRKLTLTEIADILSVNVSSVSRWLDGGNIMDVHVKSILYLIEGRGLDNQNNFTCGITGRQKCPFDDGDDKSKILIKEIDSMSGLQKAELITHIEKQKEKTLTG